MLTELNIVPLSSYQSRQETGKGIAGLFPLLDKPARHKDVKEKAHRHTSIQRSYLRHSTLLAQIRCMV